MSWRGFVHDLATVVRARAGRSTTRIPVAPIRVLARDVDGSVLGYQRAPRPPIVGPRCRGCGCSEFDPCMTPFGPCAWTQDPLGLGPWCTSCELIVQSYPPAMQMRVRRSALLTAHAIEMED